MTEHTWRTGRAGAWAVGLPLAVVGLLLGPVLMGPVYRELAPRLGSMTLLVVELLFAFLIDFPLAGLYVAIRTRLGARLPNPARSALGFTLGFFALILACVALSPAHPLFAWLGLADTFGPAVNRSVGALGVGVQGVMLACYLTFDLLLCAGAGIAGHAVAKPADRTSSRWPRSTQAARGCG